MDGLTPNLVLQVKDFLSLLALVWLVYWTYRHFVPELIHLFLGVIKDAVKDAIKEGMEDARRDGKS